MQLRKRGTQSALCAPTAGDHLEVLAFILKRECLTARNVSYFNLCIYEFCPYLTSSVSFL